ncbi:MAG TPA: sugar transferase [Angustibacter sp.]|nr:sugar transferase [Angustibacter sp.]
MTTYDESLGETDVHDRRQRAHRERVSWASNRPFMPRQRDGRTVDPAMLADRRRSSWARPLVMRLVAGDVVGAAAIAAGATASLHQQAVVVAQAAALAAVAWVAVLSTNRGYDSRLIGQGPDEYQVVLRSATIIAAGLGMGAYVLNEPLPRRYVLIAVPVLALVTGTYRYVLRRGLHHRRSQGRDTLRTLVVGNPSAIDLVVRDLGAAPHHGYSVVGACVPGDLTDVDIADDIPIVGTFSDVPQSVVDHEADVVIVAGAGLAGSSLRRLSWALERTGAELVVAPGLVEVTGPRLQMRPTAGLSLLHVEAAAGRAGRLLGKAILDRLLGLMLFLMALPVIVVSAVLVLVTSPGNPFYKQERIGRDGHPFTMWKIRTMVMDADRLRAGVLDHSDRDGLMFKMRRDPRITPVGRVLRRLSLDELPQLWNVVNGSMSLVGPRPPLPSEYIRYHDQVHRRLRVKPGVTGLWQVSGRADLSWDESIRLDLRYVDNWSIALDLQILWKTARAVLTGSGAY